jgi:hypothetical protein
MQNEDYPCTIPLDLSRTQVLKETAENRLGWFFHKKVAHREMEKITHQLLKLSHPLNSARLIPLIGMTGVGKTRLLSEILVDLFNRVWRDAGSPSDVPFIFIKAPANGEQSLSWRTLYERILVAGGEILVKDKRALVREGDVISVGRRSGNTLADIREALESMCKHRKVRLIAIDEAFHLLRFQGYAAVMDTLKSLSDVHNVKLVLVGSYDLLKMAKEYAQVARRSEILHYKRYSKDSPKDMAEFESAVTKLQAQWPCIDVPSFESIVEELMEVTLGSIGLLKILMMSCLQDQLAADGEAWNPEFLMTASKSTELLNEIRIETEAGEKAALGACYGESPMAQNDVFGTIVKKMARPVKAA